MGDACRNGGTEGLMEPGSLRCELQLPHLSLRLPTSRTSLQEGETNLWFVRLHTGVFCYMQPRLILGENLEYSPMPKEVIFRRGSQKEGSEMSNVLKKKNFSFHQVESKRNLWLPFL